MCADNVCIRICVRSIDTQAEKADWLYVCCTQENEQTTCEAAKCVYEHRQRFVYF